MRSCIFMHFIQMCHHQADTVDRRVLTAADTIASTDLMLMWITDRKCEVMTG